MMRYGIKCKVCGKRFVLERENKYETVNEEKGLLSLATKAVVYEAFDCPQCGCQNIVNEKIGRRLENDKEAGAEVREVFE